MGIEIRSKQQVVFRDAKQNLLKKPKNRKCYKPGRKGGRMDDVMNRGEEGSTSEALRRGHLSDIYCLHGVVCALANLAYALEEQWRSEKAAGACEFAK